jgi:hypothetical protein
LWENVDHLYGVSKMQSFGACRDHGRDQFLCVPAVDGHGGHNSLLEQLDRSIRHPFRTALSYTTGLRASSAVDVAAHRKLYEAIRRRDAMKARAAAERIVGIAMLAVEQAVRLEEKRKSQERSRG